MKELLNQYIAYNLWANKCITDHILSLDVEKHYEKVESSFPNLYATIIHMWLAESIWWQRINLEQKINIPLEAENPTMQNVVIGLSKQSAIWEQWIKNTSEVMLLQEYKFQNSKKEIFKQTVYDTVLHVMNHSTYHRGQLVTMMRVLGVKTIPQTDFVIFKRERE